MASDISDLITTDNEVGHQSLPEKSADRYLKVYERFLQWQKSQNTDSFGEDTMVAYFTESAKSYTHATLWSMYSMLKATISSRHLVDISRYTGLLAFLSNKNESWISKKVNVIADDELQKFLQEAPDLEYLAVKVATVFAMCGATKGEMLASLKVEHVTDYQTEIIVRIVDSRTNATKVYMIGGQLYPQIVRKYMRLRPAQIATDRFFLQYRNGKCIGQHIGKNSFADMPRKIAEYLGLPEPAEYTAHTFRSLGKIGVAGTSNIRTTVQGGTNQQTVPSLAWYNTAHAPNSSIKYEDEQEFEAGEYILSDSIQYNSPGISVKTEDETELHRTPDFQAELHQNVKQDDNDPVNRILPEHQYHHHDIDSSSPSPSAALKTNVEFDDDSASESNSCDVDLPQKLSEKSNNRYVREYKKFMKWQKTQNTTSFDEETLLKYFHEGGKVYAPTSLWSSYSMLRLTIASNHNVCIGRYTRLLAFLKEKSDGWIKKTSRPFSTDELEKFLLEAPDLKYLVVKVVVVFGICGATKISTLTGLTMEHVKDCGTEIIVRIVDPKTSATKVYLIGGRLFQKIVRKYMRLRPSNTPTDRFFIRYVEGKCTSQHIGKNTFVDMPRKVATFLGLAMPANYTAQSFRNVVKARATGTTTSNKWTTVDGTQDATTSFIHSNPEIPISSAVLSETSAHSSSNFKIKEEDFEAGEYVFSVTNHCTDNHLETGYETVQQPLGVFSSEDHQMSPNVKDNSKIIRSSSTLSEHQQNTEFGETFSPDANPNKKVKYSEDIDVDMVSNTASCRNSSLCQVKIRAQAEEIARLKQLTERQNSKIESLESLLLDKLQSKFKS